MMERNPRAPVFLSMASCAISRSASSSNSNSTSSIWKSFVYCLTSAFLGAVKISINVFSSNGSRLVITGKRPINSGIKP